LILLNNGDGTFRTGSSSTTGLFPANFNPDRVRMVAGDFNGDGKPDLSLAVPGSRPGDDASAICVILGNSDGTLQPEASRLAMGTHPVSLAVADLNGDGKPDLVAAHQLSVDPKNNNAINGHLSALLGIGDGTFKPRQWRGGRRGFQRRWEAGFGCDQR
jgi:hypothetical protein